MSASFRRVTLAPGHVLLVRRLVAASARPGYVTVDHRSRGKLQIPERVWNEGTPA